MIYDLLIAFSSFSMTVPLEMVALTISRIYLIVSLIRGVIRKFAENSRHFYIERSIELELQHITMQHICS